MKPGTLDFLGQTQCLLLAARQSEKEPVPARQCGAVAQLGSSCTADVAVLSHAKDPSNVNAEPSQLTPSWHGETRQLLSTRLHHIPCQPSARSMLSWPI